MLGKAERLGDWEPGILACSQRKIDMNDLETLELIKSHLDAELSLFDRIGILSMYRNSTLVEARSDVVRSIKKVERLIKGLREDNEIQQCPK